MKRMIDKVRRTCEKTAFLKRVQQNAHYSEEDLPLLWDVMSQILASMDENAFVSDRQVVYTSAYEQIRKNAALSDAIWENGLLHEVVITLGGHADEMQEKYMQEGKLTEAYMVEVIGSEILLKAYSEYNTWVKQNTEYAVERYLFPNKDLTMIPEILERSGLPVTCTEAFCMIPKKSVAFLAVWTKDKSCLCKGVCMGCGRKDCPNRMNDRQKTHQKLPDRPLTYGQTKIFGL